MSREKQIEECRQSMRKLGLYRYIRMGAIDIICALRDTGFFPKKPKVLKDKRMTAKQQQEMWSATIVENCLNNNAFLECFMLGEELVAFWKSKVENGKEYHHLELVPRRFTKTVTINMGCPQEGEMNENNID